MKFEQKKHKHKIIIASIFFFILMIIIFITSLFQWKSKDFWLETYFDWTQTNTIVDSKSQIDSIFNSFKQIKYKELEKKYLKESLSDDKRFKDMLSKSIYYIVPQSELHSYLVGHYRVKEFMGKDQYLIDCILGKIPHVIWLMDKRVIYKTLELQNELTKAGYDRNAFVITSGHRQPRWNETIKGARRSRHIRGHAVDITIQDINKDGIEDSEDKKIVLDLLDKKIIKNQGGLGLYPGTQSVHYDVRGRRARWNSFKR
jgi:hypothetical protein